MRSASTSRRSPVKDAGGPTGIGALYGRGELLARCLHFDRRVDDPDGDDGGVTYAPPPQRRFEAGTPMTSQVIGLARCGKLFSSIGMPGCKPTRPAWRRLSKGLAQIPEVRVIGPATPGQRHSPVAFLVDLRPCPRCGAGSRRRRWLSASGITVHGRCIADSESPPRSARVVRCHNTLDEMIG